MLARRLGSKVLAEELGRDVRKGALGARASGGDSALACGDREQ